MLAKTKDLNVLDGDHFVVPLVKDGVVHNVLDVALLALGKGQHRLGVPVRRRQQPLAVGVFAHALEQRPHGRAHLVEPSRPLLRALFESFARSAAWGHTVSKSGNGRG